VCRSRYAPPSYAAVAAGQATTAYTLQASAAVQIPTPAIQVTKPNPGRFAAAPVAKASAWPEALKTYVTQQFSLCSTPEHRTLVEEQLRKIIARVAADGRTNIHRWDIEPDITFTSQAPSTKVEADSNPPPIISENTAGTSRKRKSRFDLGPQTSSASQPSIYGPQPSIYGPQSSVDSKNEKSPKASKAKTSIKSAIELIADEREIASRDKRANRFLRDQDAHAAEKKPKVEPQKRRGRLNAASSLAAASSLNGPLSDEELASLLVVGTCSKVEKEYFRLTSAPDPSTVRPEPVLHSALELLKHKWENKMSGHIVYTYKVARL
jgi:hypothetical protein